MGMQLMVKQVFAEASVLKSVTMSYKSISRDKSVTHVGIVPVLGHLLGILLSPLTYHFP